MGQVYEFEGFRLDPEARRLMHGGRPLRLTAKALGVLEVLVERAPHVVSRAEFEAAIWPEGYVEPANLTQTIYMLRKVLARIGPQPIETVNGRGYRLVSPVVTRHADRNGKATQSNGLVAMSGARVAGVILSGARVARVVEGAFALRAVRWGFATLAILVVAIAIAFGIGQIVGRYAPAIQPATITRALAPANRLSKAPGKRRHPAAIERG